MSELLQLSGNSAVVADTSVWLDFLGPGDEMMDQMLRLGKILMHPAVIGEVALGNLRNRGRILGELSDMKKAIVATDQEVLASIEGMKLYGTGIGFADTHLIASTLMTPYCKLWTRDKRLDSVSRRLGIAWQPLH